MQARTYFASNGQLYNFMKRCHLSRRRTTTCQKPPIKRLACESCWFYYVHQLQDPQPSDQRVINEVAVYTTGHEKLRFTVSEADEPNWDLTFLFPERGQWTTNLIKRESSKLVSKVHGTSWMNQELSEDDIATNNYRHIFYGEPWCLSRTASSVILVPRPTITSKNCKSTQLLNLMASYLQAAHISYNKTFY